MSVGVHLLCYDSTFGVLLDQLPTLGFSPGTCNVTHHHVFIHQTFQASPSHSIDMKTLRLCSPQSRHSCHENGRPCRDDTETDYYDNQGGSQGFVQNPFLLIHCIPGQAKSIEAGLQRLNMGMTVAQSRSGSSFNQKTGSSIPGSASPRRCICKILNPKLLLNTMPAVCAWVSFS